MRQPGQVSRAIETLQTAITREPPDYRYQGYAWLALAHLAQDDRATALREAQSATELAPASALAHGTLGLVYFFSGKPNHAVRAARRARQLNPQSVAARVALGQGLLAQNDVDAAAREAAQAVALDPELPQARYLLGVVEAQRRDYVHAVRELEESLRLAPTFLPAAGALARVYNRVGRRDEAARLLTALLPRYAESEILRGALGELYYEQGRYAEGMAEYRESDPVKSIQCALSGGTGTHSTRCELLGRRGARRAKSGATRARSRAISCDFGFGLSAESFALSSRARISQRVGSRPTKRTGIGATGLRQ